MRRSLIRAALFSACARAPPRGNDDAINSHYRATWALVEPPCVVLGKPDGHRCGVASAELLSHARRHQSLCGERRGPTSGGADRTRRLHPDLAAWLSGGGERVGRRVGTGADARLAADLSSRVLEAATDQ